MAGAGAVLLRGAETSADAAARERGLGQDKGRKKKGPCPGVSDLPPPDSLWDLGENTCLIEYASSSFQWGYKSALVSALNVSPSSPGQPVREGIGGSRWTPSGSGFVIPLPPPKIPSRRGGPRKRALRAHKGAAQPPALGPAAPLEGAPAAGRLTPIIQTQKLSPREGTTAVITTELPP